MALFFIGMPLERGEVIELIPREWLDGEVDVHQQSPSIRLAANDAVIQECISRAWKRSSSYQRKEA